MGGQIMLDKKVFKQKNLVLRVTNKYNPMKLNLDEWEMYLDVLCGNREYQKEAIKNAVVFMASFRLLSISFQNLASSKINSSPLKL